MRRLWFSAAAIGSLLLLTDIADAQDSGPGPAANATSKQYNVMVIRASGFDQGTLAFESSGQTPNDPNATPGTTGGATNPPTTNPTPTTTANPTTPMSTPTPTTTPTPTITPTPTTNTTGTTTTTPPTTTNISGTTTPTAAATTTESLSYWSRARVNGQVATRTNDPSSSDYWTTARANGRVTAGNSTGNGSVGGGGETSQITSGTFTAEFSANSTAGTWQAIDLGGFSLWYATADSSAESVLYVGYATPNTIVGRTSVGTGGFIEAIFQGSFFVGQSMDSTSTDNPNDMSQ